jgi:phenylpyruvate tautomerase PptA (4-oxalocrotonate tautomerase family)
MVQVRVYGLADKLNPIKAELSNTIHECLIEAIKMTPDKRFHRFFPLDKTDFYFPSDRSENYTIIEISMFDGRTTETKKQLIHLLFNQISSKFNISVSDIEITIIETSKQNWGIRGLTGDELMLNYKVEI